MTVQVLGYEVDAINSVQFCTHTQYKHITGQILKSQELADLFSGLKKNELLGEYSHLLTGYIGDKGFLREAVAVAKQLKANNPNLKYVCDPVMGDDGRFYVDEALLPIYQDEVLSVADIVVPNQFEMECLTGMKISTVADAVKAMRALHEKGPSTVVLSSRDLGDHENLVMLASERQGDGSYTTFQQLIPKVPTSFTGTGDLFAALLLAWLEKAPLQEACQRVIATMQHVLWRTLKEAKEEAGEGNEPTVRHLELRVIQSLTDIQQPSMSVPSPSKVAI
ncbi:pyridoxal kinase-like isoform X2 [Watersipora subatra]|uniref:pyridoxal kinase-like isoform X2 n=1 Tax=Watersipora subatra TaxID=2589382 RepID=UPI00355B9A64